MRIMIPGDIVFLSSSIPADDAPAYSAKLFSAGEICIYDRYLWKKLTDSELATAWSSSEIYATGDVRSDNGLNYIAINPTAFPLPSLSLTNWELQTVSAWAANISYSAGAVRSKNNRVYQCVIPHTSVAEPASWVRNSYVAEGTVVMITTTWNTSSTTSYFRARRSFTTRNYPYFDAVNWENITNDLKYVTNPKYWSDVTDSYFNDERFYKTGQIARDGSNYYKAKSDIIKPSPASDTAGWSVSGADIPSAGDNWENIGAINRWRWADSKLNTVSSADKTAMFEIMSYKSRALYLGNITADSVLIEVFNGATLIESKFYKMRKRPKKWSDFFFGDWWTKNKGSIIYERSTLHREVTYRITLTRSVGNVSIGMISAGISHWIGNAEWGYKPGFVDYSTLVKDSHTGEIAIEKGKVVKAPAVQIKYRTSEYDSIRSVLDEASGQYIVVYDESGLDSLKLCGIVKMFDPVISGPVMSTADINFLEVI